VLSGPALLRVAKFILRLSITYALLYAAWLPFQGGYLRCLSLSARRVLSLVEDPPIITGLTPSGNTITLESYLSGRREPMASWNAENIHIFVVASLAVILSISAGGWRRITRRLLGSVLVIFLFTLALTVVQLRTVAEASSTGSLGLNLYSASERAFLDWANRGLITVGMLLLPTFLFLSSYMSTWSRAQSAAAASGSPGTLRSGRARNPRVRWKAISVLASAGVALMAFLLTPPRDPSFEQVREGLGRIVALNPASSQARFTLGLALEDRGSLSEALMFYQMALNLNPEMVAAWFNQGNIHFRQGSYAEAARCYREVIHWNSGHTSARNNLGDALVQQGLYDQAAEAYEEALRIDEGHAITHKNLGETLLHLKRRCEALAHLQRSTELDQGLAGDPRLQARIAALKEECGESRGIEATAYPAKR